MTRCLAAVTLSIVLLSANTPVPSLASEQLGLLGTADPCDCDYPPFMWSYSDIWGFAADGREYAVLGASDGVYIIDVTTPASPQVASFVNSVDNNWRDMKVIGNYVISVSEGQYGVQIIDVSNPYGAFEAAVYTDWTTAHNVFIDEVTARAYLFGIGNNNPILDVSNPLAPVQIGNYNDYYLHDGYVRNNILYGAKIYDDPAPFGSGLYIMDVSNPGSITTLGIATWPTAFCHNAWLTEDGAYCLTTDENQGGHVRIWDVQNPAAVQPISEYEVGSNVIVHNVFVRGDRAYISYYFQGVRVIDLSDINNPVELGFYDTTPGPPTGSYGGVWGVYPFLPTGIILGSDVDTGLYVLEPPGGTTAVALDGVGALANRSLLKAIYPNPFNPATTIALTVPDGVAAVRVGIYDVRGRLVHTLHEGTLAAGEHRLSWNGRDAAGQPSASGTYYVQLDAGNHTESQPLVLVK